MIDLLLLRHICWRWRIVLLLLLAGFALEVAKALAR